MNRAEAKNYINNNPQEHLTKDKSGKGYICPVCGSGTGKTGTGITTKDGIHFTCWAGCFSNADMIDIIALENGISGNYNDKLEMACRVYNIDFKGLNADKGASVTYSRKTRPETQIQAPDLTDFLLQAKQNNDFKYLESRGITKETQERFNVGLNNGYVIIPTQKGYISRATGTEKRYQNPKGVTMSLFNARALNNEIVFVVESAICSMSIEQAGYSCIAFNGAGNYKLLLDEIDNGNGAKSKYILLLDNDEAGKRTQSTLAKELLKRDIAFIEGYYDTNVKDPNEYLLADETGFTAHLNALYNECKGVKVESNKYNALEELNYFKTIESQKESFEVKTGYDELDDLLTGGLHEGLYVLGAVSSLGKTTFTIQMADQIAEQGQDVLFFSLEMSRHELMAKSISRHSYMNYRNAKSKQGNELAKDTQHILNNRLYKFYDTEEKEALQEAIKGYEKQAEHLFIIEGKYKGQRVTADIIKQVTENHIKETGNKPVVFIDYLQIIGTPPEQRYGTDKMKIDEIVETLKDISRENKIPVFVVSSFNRASYKTPVSMESFKESGIIEYTADILLGLQPAFMVEGVKDIDEKIKEMEKAQRNKEAVQLQLKVLKNRNGYKGSMEIDFTASYNFYESRIGKTAYQNTMKVKTF